MSKPRLALALVALGSSLALVASLALPASAATSTGSSSGQLVATGTVVSASGHAVPGAQVFLSAWPSSWENGSARHPIGQKVALIQVGRTVTSSAGTYSLNISSHSASAIARSAAWRGIVNFQISVASGDGDGAYFFSRHLSAGNDAGLAGSSRAAETPAIRLLGARGRAYNSRVCGTAHSRLEKKYAQKWAPFGASYSTTHGVTQGFEYSDGQSTSFSIGLSASGDKGSYTADGHSSLSRVQRARSTRRMRSTACSTATGLTRTAALRTSQPRPLTFRVAGIPPT